MDDGKHVKDDHDLICAREQYFRLLSERAGKRSVREIDKLSRLFASHKLTEKKLSYQVERDNLLCAISNTLLERSFDEIDGGICWALERFGVFSGIDRACIIQTKTYTSKATRTHSWCAPTAPCYLSELVSLPELSTLWPQEKLSHCEPLTMHVVQASENGIFSNFLDNQGIQSLLIAPLCSQDVLFGALCLETVNMAHIWNDDDLTAVRLLTNILVTALSRLHFERERNLLEEQLQIRQRMDSLGTLAGGIAHDFNNLLGAIIGNLDLLLTYEPDMTPRQRDYIKEAFQVAKRAAKLTAEIQSLSRGGVSEKSSVDIFSIANEVFTILERTTDKVIEKKIIFSPETYYVEANANQLHQVFLNLGTNAVHAIEERGARPGDHITIKAKKYTATLRDKTNLAPGLYVHIFFKDSGIGMNSETRRRAFDPLFTTKSGGRKGQGLGLAMVYNIITKNHGGYIDIESKEGSGTTIHLYLPIACQISKTVHNDAISGLKGNETILVIEDEDPVREVVTNSLENNGYTVITAVSGDDGLHAYEQYRDSIDLILLDLTMPKVSGEEVYNHIMSENQNMKIVITSGHSEDAMSKFPLARGFLPKPFELKSLGTIVRTALDEDLSSVTSS